MDRFWEKGLGDVACFPQGGQAISKVSKLLPEKYSGWLLVFPRQGGNATPSPRQLELMATPLSVLISTPESM